MPPSGARGRVAAPQSTPFGEVQQEGQPDMASGAQDHKAPRKTAAEILALEDTRTDEVHVPEWGTDVKVRGLTKRQQLAIREASIVEDEVDAEKSQLGMWREGVVEPVFEEQQLPLLFEKNAGAVDRVLKRILELSGMKPEALKAKEADFR